MALVDYSGSESSDEDERFKAKEALKPKASNKTTFQKVVDRSNPHKIHVSLPKTSGAVADSGESERPSKRAKLGSGGLKGFNALLPAPKREATGSQEGAMSNNGRNGSLRAGVSLRTGSAPGFSREQEPTISEITNGDAEADTPNATNLQRDEQKIEDRDLKEHGNDSMKEDHRVPEKPAEELKTKGKTTMFKPLSVARKPQKKKLPPSESFHNVKDQNMNTSQPLELAPKVSLFSTGELHDKVDRELGKRGTYEPMVYDSKNSDDPPSTFNPYVEQTFEEPVADSIGKPDLVASTPQSLDAIASDLNLSAAAKRRLLGRQKHNSSSVNIVNFNTDEEYKANQLARQSGEQLQHNPVRAIAPGKHSLKQLVNMGANQAEALEESFASGRRNRNEAGSKYGW